MGLGTWMWWLSCSTHLVSSQVKIDKYIQNIHPQEHSKSFWLFTLKWFLLSYHLQKNIFSRLKNHSSAQTYLFTSSFGKLVKKSPVSPRRSCTKWRANELEKNSIKYTTSMYTAQEHHTPKQEEIWKFLTFEILCSPGLISSEADLPNATCITLFEPRKNLKTKIEEKFIHIASRIKSKSREIIKFLS